MIFPYEITINGEKVVRPAILVKQSAAFRQAHNRETDTVEAVSQDEYVVFLSFSDPQVYDLSGELTSTPHVYIDSASG
jgi:hypothetical protein